MLSAYNSDMKEEVFISLRTGDLYVYVEKLDILVGRKLKMCASRVEINFLIKHKRIEPLGKL